MKSIIILYASLVVLSLSGTVYSYPIYQGRLYDIIRKTMNQDSDTLLLEVRLHKYVRSTTISPIDQQSQSMENGEENQIQARDSWDSGEENYFKWASLNRRPMESLAGRKRSIEVSKDRPRTDDVQLSELVQENRIIPS